MSYIETVSDAGKSARARRRRLANEPPRRSRAVLLVALGVSVALAAGCRDRAQAPPIDGSRTSVLWLTLCTLRADHLGAYGYERDVSPVIDALARRSVLFENALTSAPWTRASIAAASTGLYPRTLDIEEPSAAASNRRLPDRFQTLAERLQEAGYYTIGITANPNTHAVFNFDQGFDYYQDTGRYLWRTGYSRVKRTAEDVNAAFLVKLAELDRDRRFFAHLTYVDVHSPRRPEVALERLGDAVPAFGDTRIDHYDLQIRYLDWAIQRLLDRLQALGREDVLVVISSDHGEAFGTQHAGDVGHGRTVYNETTWVPLIFHHPSLEKVAGRRSARVSAASITPTILDLLGFELEPSVPAAPSLEDWVYDRRRDPSSDVAVIETCFLNANRSALLREPWKLISSYALGNTRRAEPESVGYELYRIDVDRDEATDLVGAMPEKVAELGALLRDWQSMHAPQHTDEKIEVDVPVDVLRNLEALGYIE